MSEEKSNEELLRERWEGQEERIQKIIESAKKQEDWTVHLEGLPFVDEIKPREGEKSGRDLRWIALIEEDLSGTNLFEADLREADLRRAKLSWAILIGADLKGAILSGADLSGADLTRADLSRAILVEASLSKADLTRARLGRANLSRADLNRADLSEADLSEADLFLVDLSKADLSRARLGKANLSRADLSGAYLSRAHLTGADLRGANLSEARLRGANLENANVTDVRYNRQGRYRGIRAATCYGSPRFTRFAQDQDFIEEFRSVWWRWPVYLLWLILADCGRSLTLWAGWAAAMAVGFAAIYFYHLGPDAFKFVYLKPSFGNTLYYSVVTFTTLGFGDVLPKTSEATRWVMAEVIMGYVMLGGLISIFATKLARRS